MDVICNVETLLDRFDAGSFDVVVSTEMLEHVLDWRIAVNNLKGLIKPGGSLVLTTRSIGTGYHAYPYDFWRFQIEDFKEIFSDMKVEALEKDSLAPGVFIKAQKDVSLSPKDLSEMQIYSIITKQLEKNLTPEQIARFDRLFKLRLPLIKVGEKIASIFTP